MSLKKMKDPFLIISLLLFLGALATAGLLYQQLSQAFQHTGSQSNIDLTEDDENFNYLLPHDATEFQEGIFEQLLEAKETFVQSPTSSNQEAVVGLVVQNFIADFFTWTNKTGRHDVGGQQFVASDIRTDFRQAAIDGFYLYLNQYLQDPGPERLIEVTGVTIDSVDLNAQWETVETDAETGEEIFDYQEVIKVEARWTYRPGFWHFQNEAVFYLTEENGYFVIRAMVEPVVEAEEGVYE